MVGKLMEKELFDLIRQVHTVESQLDVLVEECAEFVNENQKFKRNRNTVEHILKELADILNVADFFLLLPETGHFIKDYSNINLAEPDTSVTKLLNRINFFCGSIITNREMIRGQLCIMENICYPIAQIYRITNILEENKSYKQIIETERQRKQKRLKKRILTNYKEHLKHKVSDEEGKNEK